MTSTTPPPDPARLLRDRLRAGPVPFAEVMAAALYGPGGYYRQARHPAQPAGDYVTSPQVHPAFGALLGLQAAAMWDALGRPATFRVAEFGAGDGALAGAFLEQVRRTRPAFAAALRYGAWDHPRDGGPTPVEGVAWHDAEAPVAPGSVDLAIANELVDALPVHLIERGPAGEPRERWVGLRGEALAFEAGPLSRPDLAARLAAFEAAAGRPLGPGEVAEVRPDLDPWLARLGVGIHRGWALVIDYAAPARELVARPGGTLRAFARHRPADDVLASPGRQDLTATVDLDALRSAAELAGLQVLGTPTQAEALGALGIGAWIAGAPRREGIGLGQLVARGGLGDFRVAVLGRGVDEVPLAVLGQALAPAVGTPGPPLAATAPDPARNPHPSAALDEGSLWEDLFRP